MDEKDTERREFFRVEVVTPVKFKLIQEKGSKPLTDWIKGITTDVSLGGVKITADMTEDEAETLVRQYVRIKLSFKLPGTAKAVAATATIAYFLRGAMESKSHLITFGVSFVKIDSSAEDVISGFIHKRIDSPA